MSANCRLSRISSWRWLPITCAACCVSAWWVRWASSMACWIWILGSACSSIFELNSAMTYFHALTNGLAMGLAPPLSVGVCPEPQLIVSATIATPSLAELGDGHRDDRRNDDFGAGVDVGRARDAGHRPLPAGQL